MQEQARTSRILSEHCVRYLPAALLLFTTLSLLPAFVAGDRPPKQAESRKEAQSIIEKCKAVYDLASADQKPYRLRAVARSRATSGGALSAKMTLLWDAPDTWREEVESGEGSKVRVRRGDQLAVSTVGPWTAREAYMAAYVRNALSAPSQISFGEAEEVSCFHHQQPDGRKTIDIVVRSEKGVLLHGWRFDSETGELLQMDSAGQSSTTYESRKIGDRLLLSTVEHTVDGILVSQWSVTEFTEVDHHDDSLAAVPEGAVVAQACAEDSMKPKVIKQVKPEYPPEAQRAGMTDRIVLSLLIGRDGKVVDVYVVQSRSKPLEESAVKAVRQWKWKLPPCMADQAPIDHAVTIRFTL